MIWWSCADLRRNFYYRWINTNVMELLWNEMESTFPKWSKHSGLSMTPSAHIAKEMKIHSERVHDAARTDSLQTGYFWKWKLKKQSVWTWNFGFSVAQKLCNKIIKIIFQVKAMYLQGPVLYSLHGGYKPQMLCPKIEEFSCLVHKLSVILRKLKGYLRYF